MELTSLFTTVALSHAGVNRVGTERRAKNRLISVDNHKIHKGLWHRHLVKSCVTLCHSVSQPSKTRLICYDSFHCILPSKSTTQMNKFLLVFILFFVPAMAFASGPSIWSVNSRADVLKGDARGVSIDQNGTITLAPKLAEIFKTEQSYIWSSAVDGSGNVYSRHRRRRQGF